MFLYYFDSDLAELPRGVIDLEYYSSLAVSDGNVITMSPQDGIPLRSYYFQIEDQVVLADWMGSLARDRYQLVLDEKNAYQALQEQFSGEMNYASKMMESSAVDKEKMQVKIPIFFIYCLLY